MSARVGRHADPESRRRRKATVTGGLSEAQAAPAITWAIEPGEGLTQIVVARDEPGGVVHKRVMASVPPKAAEKALAKLQKKYGPAGERLPADLWDRRGAHTSPKEGTMSKKAKSQKKTANGNGAEIPEATLKQIAGRLESGASGIREEGEALGFSSGKPVRDALRGMLGEKQYDAVIAAGRAARSEQNGKSKPKAAKKSNGRGKSSRKKKSGRKAAAAK